MDDAAFRVYSLIGDGECNEGSIWEAAQIASNLQIDKLTVLMDRNLKSSYTWMKGRNDIEPLTDKWRAFNWEVFECDGHDFASITQALHQADSVRGKPAIVICHTIKGKGIPYVENYPAKPNILLTEDNYRECLEHLDALEKELQND
jgi:transketolase